MKTKLLFFIILLVFFSLTKGVAQIRTKIDEERKGVWYLDKKALELSEKFKRWDNNYYVGHMYEGSFKYNRASDYLGYKNAIKALEIAINLMEKQHQVKLKTRTSDLLKFIDAYQFQLDYSWLCYLLYECYSNIEQPTEAVAVIERLKNKRQQKNYFLSPHVTMSWLIHRNRYHFSDKYPFLKNSIEDNESMALRHLDTALTSIQRNYSINSSIFNPGHEETDLRSVYFSKTIIYSYNFEMDSAEYYYDLLRGTPSFSNNNYAYTKIMNGEFKETIQYFELEKAEDDFSRKNTKEFYYMLALLTTYQGKPEKGIKDLHEIISKQGSTPGFGWNNLGLARNYYYNGLLSESNKYLGKASSFEEMHIGTTWAREHYDFTKNVFSYLNKERAVKSIPFEDKNYWYKIPTLLQLSKHFLDQQTDKFLLLNKFGANPERDYVYYHIFSPENTITFDEIWKIIDGLDSEFFLRKFQEYLKDDSRENVKRYYKYFIARLLVNKKEYEKAELLIQEVLNDAELDHEQERLLKARCFETLCAIYQKIDEPLAYKEALNSYYSLYPQLVPFSSTTMSFNLSMISSLPEAETANILAQLKGCSVIFLEESNQDPAYPTATINVSREDSVYSFTCQVINADGTIIASQPSFSTETLNGSGKRLAYYLFNVPVTSIPEYADNNYWILFSVLGIIVLLWITYSVKKSLNF